MKFGFVLPFGSAIFAADCAHQAEAAGWDGFFVWEPVWGTDAWISLTAAAMKTSTIKLGTHLSPLSRMRPWKVASEAATLDQLTGGRIILSVGLGALETGFQAFGEETDRKIRAELLDESLEIITRLWKEDVIQFQGKHFRIDTTLIDPQLPPPPKPGQATGIPIWVVGAWFNQKSMLRVMKHNGLLPNILNSEGKAEMRSPTPAEVHAMAKFCSENVDKPTTFDLIVDGQTDPSTVDTVRQYAASGATWWLETCWNENDPTQVLDRIKAGPPQI